MFIENEVSAKSELLVFQSIPSKFRIKEYLSFIIAMSFLKNEYIFFLNNIYQKYENIHQLKEIFHENINNSTKNYTFAVKS